LSDFEQQQKFQRHGASRGLFATAELLVKLTIINFHFTSASDSLNLCTKIINNILFTPYYCLAAIIQVSRFWNSLACQLT